MAFCRFPSEIIAEGGGGGIDVCLIKMSHRRRLTGLCGSLGVKPPSLFLSHQEKQVQQNKAGLRGGETS